jgi:hypothetical protein
MCTYTCIHVHYAVYLIVRHVTYLKRKCTCMCVCARAHSSFHARFHISFWDMLQIEETVLCLPDGQDVYVWDVCIGFFFDLQ